ncbi:S49 family peptidase [Marinobacter sp. C2H3]|uniref:S49 family peptidase n=1 Tax=Marinobacter sp. C2H3 TaxID=3119003 RepID=UPI00300E7AC0
MSDWDSDKPAAWDDEPAARPNKPQGEASRPPGTGREWKLIEKLVMSLQAEQRRSRRWGIFFKVLTFGYLFALLFLIRTPLETGLEQASAGPHTAVIDVNGPIAADELASADNLIDSLRKAFDDEQARGVILRINSPGGSPVQAGYVYDEIRRLRALHPDKKVYAVISDIGASGAYYIASAADQIYANRASLVGSIGVIASGFGFTGLMDKLGVDRRLYTAGENKAFLDAFSPEKPEEVQFWQSVLKNTHKQFIDAVKAGRGDRLADDPKLFSGLVWSGDQAQTLGLIDGLGSASSVARDVIGAKELVDYSHRKSALEGWIDRLGVSFGEGFAGHLLESRLSLQ